MHVFEGDAIVALREVASSQWQATLFAEEGSTCRVRVSGVSRAAPMELRWTPAGRPVNTDFAEALVLEGASGSVDGSSAGATLEPGEAFGGLAATTWFRWIAPSDGLWEFYTPAHRVLVFEGGEVTALRLVGQIPSSSAYVPVGAGREYCVAMAGRDAAGLGGEYTLRWYEIHRSDAGNDLFEAAESLGDAVPSERVLVLKRARPWSPGSPRKRVSGRGGGRGRRRRTVCTPGGWGTSVKSCRPIRKCA
ncbi:MAG: hypothetical protein F4X36_19835 [Gammaproteobacteria bacterium]|nr:hypothetical protein [Gammaproteobacteria bacterium]